MNRTEVVILLTVLAVLIALIFAGWLLDAPGWSVRLMPAWQGARQHLHHSLE